ncbi:MAG: FoF1 ATP synthase subunit gamma [Porticoccaceae bacterium]
MSRRRSLEQHRHSLAEIREIMHSMKTLAYMETRKLARFLEAQQQVVRSIETAATDLLDFYPEILPQSIDSNPVYLLIGSERGFCGDYNHVLLNRLNELTGEVQREARVIAVGHKLCTLMDEDPRVIRALDGAGIAEEVIPLLNNLVKELSQLQQSQETLSLICLYHNSPEQVGVQFLLPPFQSLSAREEPSSSQLAPLLHMEPQEFLLQLTQHYLLASLHEVLYTSLMAENHHRVAHLEGAVKHLDDESDELARACNGLRQEEITEEIEVILLSSENLFRDIGDVQQRDVKP